MFPFLAALCATLWIAFILVLIIVVLFLQQNIEKGSVKSSSGFDEKESRLKNGPNIKNEEFLYQNRKRRSLSNDAKQFLKKYSKYDPDFKKNLKEVMSHFESMLYMGRLVRFGAICTI